ncbi:MAG: arginine--tRNA ligase [Candidatus Thermoplasmatota archaeon]|nr:arginine--tRNA ligase [Candidatus Thermoplasmatota archaeon]
MMYPLEECKKEILTELHTTIAHYTSAYEIQLEIPPEHMGDFAFPCFQLAPILKKSPNDIAKQIEKKLKKTKWVSKIESQGGYVNFHINTTYLTSATLQSILEKNETYGHLEKKEKKVIIEHTSANPNGPLHVGRARNPIIGDTLVRIYKAAGYTVESQFYLDDMGKQVAILAWGINNIEQKKIPPSDYNKADHQMVGFYQLANEQLESNGAIAEQIGKIVKQLEKGTHNTIKMIQAAYEPVLEGIKQSLKRINVHIDTYIPESTFMYDKSVDRVVNELKQTSYCREQDSALYIDMEPFGIHGRNTKFFFLRSDSTTLYATRDIAYHQWKANQADILINVLGEDHKLEAKQVRVALELLHTKILPKIVFYAFVSLPGGKMSTRRGRVVYLDELIDECIEHAYEEVKKRRSEELTEQQMRTIAELIGIGSLRYNIIKVQPEKDIVFTWEDALNFEGNAVPFVQYAHARASSILSKATNKDLNFESTLLTHVSEIALVKKLARFPLVIEDACQNCKPHVIANYLFEVASVFNQFYRDCPVLSEEKAQLRSSRLALVNATTIVLRNALELLGISAPEEM